MTQPGMTPPPGMNHPDVHPFSFTASDEALAELRPAQLGRACYPKLIHYNRLPNGGHFAAWSRYEWSSYTLQHIWCDTRRITCAIIVR
jgi:hypothetical protein